MRRVLLLNPDHAHAESALGTSTTTSAMAPAQSTKRPFVSIPFILGLSFNWRSRARMWVGYRAAIVWWSPLTAWRRAEVRCLPSRAAE
jgi:hypothetical protein